MYYSQSSVQNLLASVTPTYTSLYTVVINFATTPYSSDSINSSVQIYFDTVTIGNLVGGAFVGSGSCYLVYKSTFTLTAGISYDISYACLSSTPGYPQGLLGGSLLIYY
jgi:hypothetical protein